MQNFGGYGNGRGGGAARGKKGGGYVAKGNSNPPQVNQPTAKTQHPYRLKSVLEFQKACDFSSTRLWEFLHRISMIEGSDIEM